MLDNQGTPALNALTKANPNASVAQVQAWCHSRPDYSPIAAVNARESKPTIGSASGPQEQDGEPGRGKAGGAGASHLGTAAGRREAIRVAQGVARTTTLGHEA